MKKVDSLAALSYRPFARLFFGATISNIGTWIETVAVGIYLQSTTADARYVAIGAAAAYLPHALMGLFSGAMADRFSRQKILIINNLCAALIAGFLAFSIIADFATPLIVISCVFVTGFINAISFPAWQAFLADIVPNDKVPGALTLMMAQWNAGRIVGPVFAAILLINENYALAFFANAATFIFVSIMLMLIRPHHYQRDIHLFTEKVTGVKNLIFGGWIYIFSEKSGLRKPFIVFSIFIVFASPFIALVPNTAEELFNNRNLGTSLLTTAQGIGAVLIALFITTFQKKYSRTAIQKLTLLGLPISLLILALSPNLIFGFIAAFIFGVCYAGAITSITVVAQMSTPPQLKGRVAASFMSSIGLIFPIASVIAGTIVNNIGPQNYFLASSIALIAFLSALGTFSTSYKLPNEYAGDQSPAEEE